MVDTIYSKDALELTILDLHSSRYHFQQVVQNP